MTNSSKSMQRGTSRMLRSALIISIVIFVGWLLGSVARNQINFFMLNLLSIFMPMNINNKSAITLLINATGLVTCISIIAAGINAPILIITKWILAKNKL
jgi:hypothetical protein